MRISDWSSDVCSSDLSDVCPTDQSSGAMVTRSPSRPASIEIWQESREFALRWELLSSRSFSSSPTGGRLSAQASSTKRSEERRVGKERVSTCRYRWSPKHKKKTKQKNINQTTT